MKMEHSLSNTDLLACMAVAFVLAALLTGALRWYALQQQWLDVPNARSSHTAPTPRGGGLAFVITFLLAVAGLTGIGVASISFAAAVLPAGAVVAILGFVDDRRSIPARWRFMGHGIAAVWSLCWLSPLPPLPLPGISLDLDLMGPVLYWLLIVWMINLYNFMDGIDGLAGMQVVAVSLGGALAGWLAGLGPSWMGPALLAASVAGFLIWNFPPARIFMGDAGSGFLGLAVALIGIASAIENPVLAWSWLILTGCFVADATTTLIRRLQRGERANEAHRNHAYQYAARQLGSHRTVTLVFLAVNLLWLTPIACAVAMGWVDGLIASLLAYTPLIAMSIKFKAGDRLGQEA